MKKLFSLTLCLAMTATMLVGCGKKDPAPTVKTPEELTTLYTQAINNHGGEMLEYNPVITEVKQDDMSGMMMEFLGLRDEDYRAFAISMSMMNIQAYAIAAVAPAEGKEDSVKAALQGYIDTQISAFETYLPGPYENAKNARLETLSDGTVLLVMCEEQDSVFEGISKDILAQ